MLRTLFVGLALVVSSALAGPRRMANARGEFQVGAVTLIDLSDSRGWQVGSTDRLESIQVQNYNSSSAFMVGIFQYASEAPAELSTPASLTVTDVQYIPAGAIETLTFDLDSANFIGGQMVTTTGNALIRWNYAVTEGP